MSDEIEKTPSDAELEHLRRNWFKIMKAVPRPERLKNRPTDNRGYMISFTTSFTDKGTPKLLSSEIGRRLFCWRNRVCGVCGDYLDQEIVQYIGFENLQKKFYEFEEPFMHRECAEYAAKTCPFLALPDYKYIKETKPRPGYTPEEWNSGLEKLPPGKMFFYTTTTHSEPQFEPNVRVWVVAAPPVKEPEPLR